MDKTMLQILQSSGWRKSWRKNMLNAKLNSRWIKDPHVDRQSFLYFGEINDSFCPYARYYLKLWFPVIFTLAPAAVTVPLLPPPQH